MDLLEKEIIPKHPETRGKIFSQCNHTATIVRSEILVYCMKIMGEKKEDNKRNTIGEDIAVFFVIILFIGLIFYFLFDGKEKIFDWSLRYDNWKLDKTRSELICSKLSGTAKSDFASKKIYKTCMKDRKNKGHY